jgi:D-alanyl-D-alanine carboxypeptidase/D-alanyl-D-alanine-endopeptidase (penicillin-binding protein 4)
MKFFFFWVVLILSLHTVLAQNPDFVNEFVTAKACENASFTILGINIVSGDTVFAYDSKRSLAPASIQKLFSTSAALELKGSNYQFKTELAYSGTIDKQGVLQGDVYIIGYGDPALGSSRFESFYNNPESFISGWVHAISDAGIKSISGNIIGDPSEFCYPTINSTWLWEDIANHYGSPACGLSIGDNIYSLFFNTGNTDGTETELLKMEPEITDYTFENYVTASATSGDEAYIFGGPESTHRVIKGTLPWKNSGFKIKGLIANPPLYVAQLLKSELEKSNITVMGKAESAKKDTNRPATSLLNTINSPPIHQIIKLTNMWSINLYAEHFAGLCGLELKNNANLGNEAVFEFWESKGMNTNGLHLEDGCGLSHFNTMNAEHVMFVLRYMMNSTNKSIFLESLPVAGKSGTLQWYCRTSIANDRIIAKGGSMTRVRSLAGYATCLSGQEIAFVIIVNNYNCDKFTIKKYLENFMTNMVKIL